MRVMMLVALAACTTENRLSDEDGNDGTPDTADVGHDTTETADDTNETGGSDTDPKETGETDTDTETGETDSDSDPVYEVCNVSDDDGDGAIDEGTWSLVGTASGVVSSWSSYGDTVGLCQYVGASAGFNTRSATMEDCNAFALALVTAIQTGEVTFITSEGFDASSGVFATAPMVYDGGAGFDFCFTQINSRTLNPGL